ncbi:MAG: sel1 repeat family protein, partial [Nitrospina sp.]|nr:sel1 repeat family protein [Nitrospina sp.]
MKKIALAILTLILLVEPVSADDFQDGKDAYKRSDYKTALEKWKPLAEQGNANGQNGLGVLYANGQGVAQDYREAVKWYRLSAEQGVAKAQYNLGVMY